MNTAPNDLYQPAAGVSNPHAKRERTKTPLLFFAVILLCIAVFMTALTATGLLGGDVRDAVLPLGIISAAVLLVGLGLLLLYIMKVKGKPQLKPIKAAIIILAVITGLTLYGTYFLVSNQIPVITLNNRMSGFSPSEKYGEVPEDPRFVFYNMNTGKYRFPGSKNHVFAAKNPDEINVVVYYDASYDNQPGLINFGVVSGVSVDIYIYRFDTGELIDHAEMYENRSTVSKSSDILEAKEGKDYIAGVLKGEITSPTSPKFQTEFSSKKADLPINPKCVRFQKDSEQYVVLLDEQKLNKDKNRYAAETLEEANVVVTFSKSPNTEDKSDDEYLVLYFNRLDNGELIHKAALKIVDDDKKNWNACYLEVSDTSDPDYINKVMSGEISSAVTGN